MICYYYNLICPSIVFIISQLFPVKAQRTTTTLFYVVMGGIKNLQTWHMVENH